MSDHAPLQRRSTSRRTAREEDDASVIVLGPDRTAASSPGAARRALAARTGAANGNRAAGRAAGVEDEPQDAYFGARAPVRVATEAPEAQPQDGGVADRPPPRVAGERAPAAVADAAADAAAGPSAVGGAAPEPEPAGVEGAAAPAAPEPAAADVRTAVATVTSRLPHPALRTPAQARAPVDEVRAGVESRGAARVEGSLVQAEHLVRLPPAATRRPPREDASPIPEQMRALRERSGRTLPAAALPAVTRSPLGTLPDVTGPVLTAEEILAISLGQTGIEALTSDPEERRRLQELHTRLTTGAVATAAPPAAPAAAAAPAPPLSVAIADEPVAGAVLGGQQRAFLTALVGRLKADPEGEARGVLAAARARHSRFPGGLLAINFPELGSEIVPRMTVLVRTEADRVAEAIRLAPEEIEAAVVARRAEVEAQRQAAAQSVANAGAQAAGTATAVRQRAEQAGSATARTATAAVAADATPARPRAPGRTQERVERTVVEIREQVSTELARYDAQLRNRRRAITDSIHRQVAAVRLAQTRDELALEPLGLPAAAQAGEVRRWADGLVAALEAGDESAQQRLDREATTATEGFKRELDEAAGAAFAALRAWGGRQSTSTEAWWTARDAELERWAAGGTARALQWQRQRAEAARLALTQDVAAIQRVMDLQLAGDRTAAREYVSGLDIEGRAAVQAFTEGLAAGAPDVAGALTAAVRERIRAAQQPSLERSLEEKLLALPDDVRTSERLRTLLPAVQPGFNPETAVDHIREAVSHWTGFDEAAIFAELTGMTPVGTKILRIEYQDRTGQSLDAALSGTGHIGYLNRDEQTTADQLLRGEGVAGAAGALHSALEGLGTNTDAIRQVLRALPPQQRQPVLDCYRERYKETLAVSLEGEMIPITVRDEALALSRGDLRGADAIALGRAVHKETSDTDPETGEVGETYATLDRQGATAVFATIRREVEDEGTRRGWTSAQVEAEITLRNREVETTFDERFADAWWTRETERGPTALRTAFALSSGAGRDLLNAVADNDRARADLALLRLEDQGIYAEDAAINAVFRDQQTRSLAEVNRDLGPLLRTQMEARLERETFRTPEEQINRRMELEREDAARMAQLADERTRARMTTLDTLYQAETTRSLRQMVEANTSGTAREEALARVAGGGVLTPYQRLRFSMEGVGTDLPMLRSALAGMTPKEREDADACWRRDHGGESLVEAIQGDTSGREQGDLVDLAEKGTPRTVADVAAAAQRRYDRDRAGETSVGRWLSSDAVAAAGRDVARLQQNLAELRRTDLSADERRRLTAQFDVALERATGSIELQRRQVDALADTLSTGAAIVTALVVGALLSVPSGGASDVVAAAVIASLMATAAAIATKTVIKGAAYGWEQVGTDLAIGAVDALVAALTAGLSKALLTARGATAAGRGALARTAGQIGRSAAARAPSRLGLLASAVEGRTLLAGMAAAERPLYQRLAAHAAAEIIEQTVQALPSSLTASLLDERVYRQPGGGPLMVLHNTLEGTVQSVAFGLGVGAVHHGLSSAFHLVAGRFRAPEARVPTGDVLSRMGTVAERAADFRTWRASNPEGTYRDFYAARERALIEGSRADQSVREQVRQARRELLAELPPASGATTPT